MIADISIILTAFLFAPAAFLPPGIWLATRFYQRPLEQLIAAIVYSRVCALGRFPALRPGPSARLMRVARPRRRDYASLVAALRPTWVVIHPENIFTIISMKTKASTATS
jgi:hypothetical protein